MAKKKKAPITPVAPCMYPFLKKPDTRWKKDGEYRVALVFDQNDAFVEKVEAKAKKEFEKAKDNMKPAQAKKLEYVSPVKEDEDEDGNPTGNVRLNFKSNAQYTKDDTVYQIHMKLFDAQGKPIVKVPNIGNGSKLAISFNPVGTIVKGDFYLSLWMNAVQLVELVEFNPDGSSYGFGKEDGGYEAEDGEDDAPFGSDAPDNSGQEDPDDF